MLAKAKFNSIEVLISKALIDSNITHDEFGFVSNMLKKYGDVKEENLKALSVYWWFYSIYKTTLSHCSKCKKNTESKNPKLKKKQKKQKNNASIKMCNVW